MLPGQRNPAWKVLETRARDFYTQQNGSSHAGHRQGLCRVRTQARRSLQGSLLDGVSCAPHSVDTHHADVGSVDLAVLRALHAGCGQSRWVARESPAVIPSVPAPHHSRGRRWDRKEAEGDLPPRPGWLDSLDRGLKVPCLLVAHSHSHSFPINQKGRARGSCGFQVWAQANLKHLDSPATGASDIAGGGMAALGGLLLAEDGGVIRPPLT